ncbi:MAG: D-arabino 3-hexulose 6-phosphate aldehyde lyase [Desulfurococcales archaeon ex4484_42]|nr:MAG: D-arabino 3-hexulose 6-phosphate aldehyde lyase [Desulfurococcales archaeon ex4484_42]
MGKLLNRIISKGTLLQVALDFIELNDAIKIMRELIDLNVDIYEAGTPLIKNYGLRNLGILRSIVGSQPILLADTKTVDVGALEAELAYRNSFDAITVLGSSDDEVIKSTLKKAKELDIDVVIDTIGISEHNLARRLEELKTLNVNIVNIHTGIDVQRLRGLRITDRLGVLKDLISSFKSSFKFSVSGGIRPDDIPKILELDVSIIVIGSAITKSDNPRESTRKALQYLRG